MKKFDVLIVGTGMGGLVCGNILSKQGYSVCMVEKNKQLGGCLQIYVRNKVLFDSGVHYLGGLDKGQNLYQIFKWLGIMDELTLERMDPVFDRILISGNDKEYPIVQGYEAFEKQMINDFPDEGAAIRTYTETIRTICDDFPLYRLQTTGTPGAKEDAMQGSARAFIESITQNETLRAVLAGNNMLYAGSGYATPLYVHALTVNSYMESAWRCVNGGGQIAQLLARNIRQAGGTIIRKTAVTRFIMEGDRITGAALSDGTLVRADYFISNTTPANTFRMTDSRLIRPATRKRVEEMKNTVSSFIVNVVFRPESFPYNRHNYYYQKAGAIWNMDQYTAADWPLGYALYFTPSANREFAAGMTIFAYMRYDEVQPWATSFNTVDDKRKRGEAYTEFKKGKENKLLDRVEEKFPGIRQSIEHCYSSTPLTFRDYLGNSDGNLYGAAKDVQHPMASLLAPQTRVPNLFMTGQHLNLHGILGTAISGLITCIALTGKDDFIEKIRHA